MQFRSSFNIFKPKSHSFIYDFFKQSFDFKKNSKNLFYKLNYKLGNPSHLL